MKTKFEIGQYVWIMYVDAPHRLRINEIRIDADKCIAYSFDGVVVSRPEHEIGETKEELMNIVFNPKNQ